MRQSRLPETGGNLFQAIKAMAAQAEANGKKLVKLSIGQPSGAAALMAREAAAKAVMSDDESMHEYQDNGSPGVPNFAERFVKAHLPSGFKLSEVAYLPIPGIKPMLGLIPLACGAGLPRLLPLSVATTTQPGYPTPADWCMYLGKGVDHCGAPQTPENRFLVEPEFVANIPNGLLMINYPHNPSGQIAEKDWLIKLCDYCSDCNVRLFNDAAYARLDHSAEHTSLASVAWEFPKLSWVEAFSASKAGNFTAWRVGALVGSPDFVGDIAKIKGNTDSGFFAPAAAGVIELFENHGTYIDEVARGYRSRLANLIEMLGDTGMQLAVQPKAGFFSLWKIPQKAFGERVKDAAHFNSLMIERAGIVGVHFHPYIRYSVAQTDPNTYRNEIIRAFMEAEVEYE